MPDHSALFADVDDALRRLPTGSVDPVDAGDLGLLALEHAEDAPADLDVAAGVVVLLRHAVVRAGDHADTALWWYSLAVTYRHLGDWDAVLDCARRSLAAGIARREFVDATLPELARMHFEWAQNREPWDLAGVRVARDLLGDSADFAARVAEGGPRTELARWRVGLMMLCFHVHADPVLLDGMEALTADLPAELVGMVRFVVETGRLATATDQAEIAERADRVFASRERIAAAGDPELVDQVTEVFFQLAADSDPVHLRRVVECAGLALGLPRSDPAATLRRHFQRLGSLLRLPPAAYRDYPLEQWLDDGEAALYAVTDAEPELIARAAATMALGRQTLIATRWQPMDMAGMVTHSRRARELVAHARGAGFADATLEARLAVLDEFARTVESLFTGGSTVDIAHMLDLVRGTGGEMGDVAASLAMLSGFTTGDRAATRAVSDLASDSPEWEVLRAFAESADLFGTAGPGDPRLLALREQALRISHADLRDAMVGMVDLATGARPATGTVDRNTWYGRIFDHMSVSMRAREAAARGDQRAVRAACARLDDLVRAAPDGSDEQALVRTSRANAYEMLPPTRGVLDTLVEDYTVHLDRDRKRRAVTVVASAMVLARTLRTRRARGDLDASRRLGMEALAWNGYRVLLQAGTADAVESARDRDRRVEPVVEWCLADRAYDDLVRVLDAQRSLVLGAATTGRTVAARLDALGHEDLARRWRAHSGREDETGWSGLRNLVLAALAEGGDALPEAPTVDEIRAALRAHGSDALVYLLPATAHGPGRAVIVPVDAKVRVRDLPGLREAPAFTRYVAASGRERLDALGDLCTWAWEAVGRDLLSALRHLAPGPRVVLVPVGALGLVPWHAARHPDGYLVRDLTIGYVPSARMLCDVVARPAAHGGAVLLGNPTRDLPYAAFEAEAVREDFFADGVLLGGSGRQRRWTPCADGAGTPEQVLEAVAKPLRLLHLACHAGVDVELPLRSTIRLSGADLTARMLLETSPTRAAELGQVTLAGCQTGVSGADYDEALSLSTTFLALGARTVVGSLWEVPSGKPTAQLMYVLYHGMHVAGLRPGEALRRAQLWMLDPDRVVPDGLPEGLRPDPCPDVDQADPVCWAGFAHLGW
ncbi:hypothetical protein GCM10022243_34420 [Saccharothrix violaceirubra]|uniref:CHAT domain-containing protein n=1 Tax=Saccharothrix violaceirubra TaxID=413306 RepID=A0A7W7T4L6_9PSEU|nr:CHAT domain-containing protein [Saccharothrix violaceirubra]MBB4966493.1 hypothetical protein [Saccharothrix violaceirubra]